VLKTLLALEKENLLRIRELRSNPIFDEKGDFLGRWSAKDNPVARIYTLKIQTNKQEPMLIKLVEGSEVKVSGIQAPSSKRTRPKSLDLYLNKVGDLWREPKNKYCYPMNEKSERHRIVRYLVVNKGYQNTRDISYALNGKSEQSIRTEIGKIRKNISKYLKVESDEVIEGRKESGYRINPKYKITLKD